ncbi:hypothetical protein K501DRAFT_187900 [Backusella circina FSU 941]|nr:hypothetical protein K501DRAFT_187900 [Backusella circina FSU 941]
MTSLLQQQQDNEPQQYTPSSYYNTNFSYYHFLSTKSNINLSKKPSLLQKRPSLMRMSRKLSIFSNNRNKSQLSIVTPDLQRMDSLTTEASSSTESSYSNEEEYYSPTSYATPINSTTSYLSVDLETVITTPAENTQPLFDFSGRKYSNFYVKLPNGNWMVRLRDSNRKIVGTYEINGSMI